MYITFDLKSGKIINLKQYKSLDEACNNFVLKDINDWVRALGHFCCNSEDFEKVHYIVNTSFIPNGDNYDATEQRRILDMVKLEIRKIKLNNL